MELLISLAIIVVLATITVFQIQSSNRNDELNTAARQLMADIRAMQNRALAAQDSMACDAGGFYSICEASTSTCGVNPCNTLIPDAYGIYLVSGSSTYSLFADLNPTGALDNKMTDGHERLTSRTLLGLGSEDIFIDDISTSLQSGVANAHIAFSRQYGIVTITDPTTPPEPNLITIRLRHSVSNNTIEIEVNRITGRVSIL